MSVSYLVNEIYPCLQGEGPNAGRPALLVRFHICNLRCSWCDTPYTHSFRSDPVVDENKIVNYKQKRYSHLELTKKITDYSMSHIIFTGGEPTLHNLAVLMKDLNVNHTAEVESNGTRIPHEQMANFIFSDYFMFQWNISPKMSNAKEKIVPEAIEHWSSLSKKHEKTYFKFVVREKYIDQDMQEILDTIEKYKISPARVYVMAEGTTIESQVKNVWLHDICLKYGFNLSPRMHIILFGDKRGV